MLHLIIDQHLADPKHPVTPHTVTHRNNYEINKNKVNQSNPTFHFPSCYQVVR